MRQVDFSINAVGTGGDITSISETIPCNKKVIIGVNLKDHENVQRVYGLNNEAGLLLCSWPKGNRPLFPFVYADEVWSGIEIIRIPIIPRGNNNQSKQSYCQVGRIAF